MLIFRPKIKQARAVYGIQIASLNDFVFCFEPRKDETYIPPFICGFTSTGGFCITFECTPPPPPYTHTHLIIPLAQITFFRRDCLLPCAVLTSMGLETQLPHRPLKYNLNCKEK